MPFIRSLHIKSTIGTKAKNQFIFKEVYMPWKAKKVCGWPGCPETTDGRYCDKHKKLANQQYDGSGRNQQAKQFYESTAWRNLRKMKINRQPFCEECKKFNQIVRAECVDHIVEIKDGGAPLDMDNLQSLCRSCHSRKTLQGRNKHPRVY